MTSKELEAALEIVKALITDIRRVRGASANTTAALLVALGASDPTFEQRFRRALNDVERVDYEPPDPDLDQMMAVIEQGLTKIRTGEHLA